MGNPATETRQTDSPSINVVGANDRIVVGIVGLGFGWGQNHLIGIQQNAKENNVTVGAACDVFELRRSGRRPNADIELAVRAQAVLSLAEMSDRLKTTCLLDETTRIVTDGSGREITPLTHASAGAI
jgi:hypothetical protein